LSDERIELLRSFRNTSPTVWPQDNPGPRTCPAEALAKAEGFCGFLLRCPVSLSRIHWTPGSKTLFYESKQSANDDPLYSHPKGKTFDNFESIARVLTQIPEPRAHGVRYFRRLFFESLSFPEKTTSRPFNRPATTTTHNLRANPSSPQEKRAALRKGWASPRSRWRKLQRSRDQALKFPIVLSFVWLSDFVHPAWPTSLI